MEFSNMVKIWSQGIIIWCIVAAIFTRMYFTYDTSTHEIRKPRCTDCTFKINCDRKLFIENGRLIPSIENTSKVLQMYERKQSGKNKYEKFWVKVLSDKYKFTRKKEKADVIIDMEKNDTLIVFSRRNALKYKRDLENV